MTVMFVTRCSYERSESVSRTTWLMSTIVRVVCRLRAKVSRLRTMRAARSASWRMVSRPRRDCGIEVALGEPLGPRQDGRQRVVEFVRHARDGGAERGHLLGLQELMVEVARLILEPLAVADVADERLDAHGPAIVAGSA